VAELVERRRRDPTDAVVGDAAHLLKVEHEREAVDEGVGGEIGGIDEVTVVGAIGV